MYQNIEKIASAIAVINKNAKTALDPTELYSLKRKALHKLLKNGQATKLGLHYSKHPKNAKQVSDLLIKVSNFYFHLPATREDKQTLTHLGHLNDSVRNPTTSLSLNKAKQILTDYLGSQLTKPSMKKEKKQYIGTSPYLNDWQPPYLKKPKHRGHKK